MPTSPPSITAIPDFPSISDRVTYNAKAYAWANALDNVTAGEISAVATNVYNNAVEASTSVSSTSTTSLTIATGSQAFTTQTTKAWVVGQPVVIARTSAPTTTYMYGIVSAYNSTTGAMTVTVSTATGTGTYTDWSIALTGQPGPAGTGPTLVFLSAVTASNSATVDIETTLDSTYDAYVIEATSIIPQTDGVNIGCQFKLSGSYDAGSNYYYHLDRNTAGSTSYTASVDTVGTSIVVLFALSNAASANSQFFLRINAPSNSGRQKLITFSGANATAAPQVRTNTGVGMNTGTGVVTGLRFLASSGNIASGTFRLYGIKNS